tara:strand:- start:1796 stop:2116 length:321 start_codon:yes stop_codon:yes gene_type:complete
VKEEFEVSRDFFARMEEQYNSLKVELNSLRLMLTERNDMDIVEFKHDVESTMNRLSQESATIHHINTLQTQISDIKNDLEKNVVRYADESAFKNDDVINPLPKMTI